MLKRILLLVAVAGAGYAAYVKFSSAKQERDLWNEATATPDLG